jgi:hypothetical protein
MSDQEVNNLFRVEEIVWMSHFDKKTNEWIKTAYPKVGGRLRLAHGDNGSLSINTDIIHYDDKVAVVKALATTSKGQFTGLGMASIERDQRIAPAILELAETRAIARSLRFAGYGVEYCSAEEVSHLENVQMDKKDEGDSSAPAAENRPVKDDSQRAVYCSAGSGNLPGGSTIVPPTQEKGGNGGGGGNGNSRLTHKQLNFLIRLAEDINMTFKDLNEQSMEVYGVKVDHLTRRDASDFISTLKAKANK